MHTLTIPGAQREVDGREVQIEVPDQGVEPPVAQDLAQVFTQCLTLLAGDLVGVGDDVVETVVGVDPLGRVAGSDPGDPRQVVGGLPHQRRQLGVSMGRDAVLLLDRFRRHPGQIGNAAHGIEHRGVLGDQLEAVTVAGQDQDVHVGRQGLGHPGGDDVVRLEPVLLLVRDVERVQHFLDQGDLAGELGRGGAAVRLVFGVLRGSEGLPGHVEGDRQMGGLLVAQHVDQHRGEPVDGIGVLAGAGGEVLRRQREERPIGK